MKKLIENRGFYQKMGSVRHKSKEGAEFWYARDIQEKLGCAKWESFSAVIAKARMACENSGVDSSKHFLDLRKKITGGNGAKMDKADCILSRYACYLVAMSGESTKPEISLAKTYFAIQTRRQELQDNSDTTNKRIELRERVTFAFKELGEAAKQAGVKNYGRFHDAGYRGLYQMGLRDLKVKKGMGKKEQLFDRAGRAELAANEFRLTQADERLRKSDIKTECDANNAHEQVGKEVRNAIVKIGGTMPEDLPIEESIKTFMNSRKTGNNIPPKQITYDKNGSLAQ